MILNKIEIQKLIPHREPFLFVDECEIKVPGEHGLSKKIFYENEYFFKGHFPGNPIVPGVIIVEAMAQTAGIVVSYKLKEFKDKSVLFMSVNKAKFRKPILPNDEVILSNILVGEVWVCSGQSNMEWSVKASNNPGEEISNAKFPAIRLFHVPKKASSFPESDCNASWKECSPENIPNFSAVAYYFGRHLHNELKVPIGLIGSAWGGTRIEPWTPVSGFDAVPSLRGVADKVRRYTDLDQVVDRAQRWAEAVKNAVDEGRRIPSPPQIPKLNHGNPTGLYNGMIAPVVPFSVKGAIWYQGESNVGEGMAYHDKMKALISGWRDVFNNDDLSFYFVQIAPYRYNKGEALPDIW